MADKVTLEDLARQEAAALKKRETARKAWEDGQKLIVTDVPERFFTIAQGVKDGVRRFNETAYKESGNQQRVVRYEESIATTTRDPTLGTEYHFEVKRAPNHIFLALRNMSRGPKADSFLMEGQGSVGVQPMHTRFNLRIDAWPAPNGLLYRAVCNGHKIDTPIDELPERMVIVVVTGELTRLWNTPPWAGLPPPPKR